MASNQNSPILNSERESPRYELFKPFIIADDEGVPYLTRYVLFYCRSFRVYLHKFHRPDGDKCCHDHPWWFVSFILCGGYEEEIRQRSGKLTNKRNVSGMILYRPVSFAHRVTKLLSPNCWTLVIAGSAQKRWGFFTKEGWMHWKQFLKLGKNRVAWCEQTFNSI